MSQVLLQARMLAGSLLEMLTKQPQLVADLNFTLREDRDKFKASCDISDKEVIAAKFAPFLQSQVDNFCNVSSEDDYHERDIIGSYPSDDPRAGWWLLSIGYTFLHIVIGYPDVLIKKAIEEQAIEETNAEATIPNQFDGLICDFEETDLERLMEIYSIVSAAPDLLTEEDFITIDELCRLYDKDRITSIHELLGDKINKTSYLPERSYLEVAMYQPGVYIYSVDPMQPYTIENTVISIRRLDGTHYMYYFKDNKLNREPPFRVNESLHASIMKDK